MLSTVSELVGLISARSGMNRRFETVNHHHGGTCAEHFKQGKQKKKKKKVLLQARSISSFTL